MFKSIGLPVIIAVFLSAVSYGYAAKNQNRDLPSLLNEAYQLVENSQITEAVRFYKQALDQFASAAAAYNLAVIYDHYLNYNQKAITYYNKYLRLAGKPGDEPQVRTWMQQALKDLTKRRRPKTPVPQQQVSKASRSIIKTGDESRYLMKANQALVSNRLEQAIRLYQQAIAIDKSILACYNLALLYEEDLSFNKMALHYYQRVLAVNLTPEQRTMVQRRIDQVREKHEKGTRKSPFTEKFRLKRGISAPKNKS